MLLLRVNSRKPSSEDRIVVSHRHNRRSPFTAPFHAPVLCAPLAIPFWQIILARLRSTNTKVFSFGGRQAGAGAAWTRNSVSASGSRSAGLADPAAFHMYTRKVRLQDAGESCRTIKPDIICMLHTTRCCMLRTRLDMYAVRKGGDLRVKVPARRGEPDSTAVIFVDNGWANFLVVIWTEARLALPRLRLALPRLASPSPKSALSLIFIAANNLVGFGSRLGLVPSGVDAPDLANASPQPLWERRSEWKSSSHSFFAKVHG